MIETIHYFTTPEERQQAKDFNWAQAAVMWKRRTGADLRAARRMRWVFAQWAIRNYEE